MYASIPTSQDIENRFTYHKPFGTQPMRYEEIRYRAKLFAQSITDFCPPSRELSLALTKLEEAVMWANAAIARNENQNVEKTCECQDRQVVEKVDKPQAG